MGNATLYRHFTARAVLGGEVFRDALTETTAAGERARTVEDAWTGLPQYLRTVFAGLATDRCTNGLMATNLDGVTSLEAIHAHNRETIGELFRRGQEQGTIRPDLTVQDLLFTPAALGRSVPALTGVAPDARLRPLTLLPDGLRASPAAPLLLTPPPGPAVCPPPSGGPSAHEQEARSPPYGPEPDAVAARRPGA